MNTARARGHPGAAGFQCAHSRDGRTFRHECTASAAAGTRPLARCTFARGEARGGRAHRTVVHVRDRGRTPRAGRERGRSRQGGRDGHTHSLATLHGHARGRGGGPSGDANAGQGARRTGGGDAHHQLVGGAAHEMRDCATGEGARAFATKNHQASFSKHDGGVWVRSRNDSYEKL